MSELRQMREDTQNDRKLSLRPFVLIVLILIGAGILVLLQTKDSAFNLSGTPRLGKGVPAPDFTLPGLDGQMVSLADYRGKVVLLNIWATWCPPCVEEMPSMEKLYQEFKDDNLEILAVSIDALGAEVVGPFMQKYNLTFPALLDPEGTIRQSYQVTGVPESFIIDQQGVLAKKIIGAADWSSPGVLSFFRNLLQNASAKNKASSR